MAYTKYNIDKAKRLFADHNCELLEDAYKNTSTPMKYRCQCGDISAITLSDFKRGRRCKSCGNQKAAKNRQDQVVQQKEIEQYFSEQGCQLLSKYTGYTDPLKYTCSCGHLGETTWWSFKKGRRCGRCADQRKKKYSLEEVREVFSKAGCELLQDHYEGVGVPVRYRCSCGRESKITLANFRKGCRCRACGLKKNLGSNNHRWIKDRKKKRANDLFRIKCCTMLHRCLKSLNKAKNDRTHKLLGYTHKQLQEHIESHPNWERVKGGKWHIDHVFPISAFFDRGITDLKLINHLDNLQPLSQHENNSKSAKYNKKRFLAWLESHGNLR